MDVCDELRSYGWPSVLHGKKFNVGHYTQTFQPNFFHTCHVYREHRLLPLYTTFTWSKSFSRNTGASHQHTTNHWKCFKTIRTGKLKTPTISLDIPDIQAKERHTDEELRSLTLEALSVAYPSTTWARAYTDGSAEEAVKNGGGRVFIKLPDGRSIRKSVATGQQSTNYRAEAYTLLAAAQSLNQEERLPSNTVFLTDCRSILQSPQSPGGDQIFSNTTQELSLLKNKTSVTLQWIPSHCGVRGNEEADPLSKMGSKFEQSVHPMSFSEAKTILRNNIRRDWRQRLDMRQKRTASISWTEQLKPQSLD